MRRFLLSTTLCMGLGLSPSIATAQNWEQMRLNDEILNSAANYTTVLRSAHAEVQRYITWKGWQTSLSEAEQEARTAAILSDIQSSETVGATLLPRLVQSTLDSYSVRYRYCDGKLLSYFGTPGFKHNFTSAQIAEAPIYRAQRSGKRYTGRRIGVLQADSSGMVLVLASGGRQMAVPDCLVSGTYSTTLAPGTVAYISDAPQKFGVDRTRRQRETQTVACPDGKVGNGQIQTRYLRTDYSAQRRQIGTPYYDTSAGGDGNWVTTTDFCRDPHTMRTRDVVACDAVIRGPNRTIVLPGKGMAVYDYYLTEKTDETRTVGGFTAPPWWAGETDPWDFTKIVWVPSDAAGNYTTSPVGVLVRSHCDDQAPTATITPTVASSTETLTQACASGWTHGDVDYERTVTTATYTYSGAKTDWETGLSATHAYVVTYGNWTLIENTCRKWVSSTTAETKTDQCPCWGSILYERIKTTTGWDYQAQSDQFTTSYSAWSHVSGKCEPAWKIERQGGACRSTSSSGSSSGENDGHEDIDRDGVYDSQDADDGDPSVGHGSGEGDENGGTS